MKGINILALLVIFVSLSQSNAVSDVKQRCGYELIKSYTTKYLTISGDAEFQYQISDAQNGCFVNVEEIYQNITKLVTVYRTQVSLSLGFFCEPSKGSSDIHFTFSDNGWKTENIDISVQITLDSCSIYMDELTYFQKYGHIRSLSTTSTSHIHPGVSCSSLRYLRMLYFSLPCIVDKDNNTKTSSTAFFWDICDPFEELFSLRIHGCETNPYEIKDAFIQTKFPNLHKLWIDFMNISLSGLTFPLTNFFINSTDILNYLSSYDKPDIFVNNIIYRSIKITDSTAIFSSNFSFSGYVKKIVMKNVKLQNLDTLFQHVPGLVDMDLSNNEVEKVDRDAFFMQTNLTVLNLSYNKLIIFPEELFDQLQNLLYLDISSNRIIHVNQRHFMYLLKLKELNLQNNTITTLPSDFLETQINSIQYVLLSGNPLKTLPLPALYAPNVLLVDMRACQINSSSFLWVLDNIDYQRMHTSHPKLLNLQHVHSQTIDLSQNSITGIPFNQWNTDAWIKFTSIVQSFYINLDNNPIDCTCNIISIADLTNFYVKHGINIDWKCQFPLEFQGRLTSTIKPEETYCLADVKYCPDHCKCSTYFSTNDSIPESERTFIIDCRNINMTLLPEMMPTGKLKLWFKNSSLIEIAPRDYLKNVIDLDVSHNRINKITYDTAKALSNVSTAKFDHNNLTQLPEQLARMNMSSITLSRNPFICDCKMKWMKSWYRLTSNPVKKWEDIECTYNTGRVKKLIDLADSMFVCEDNSEKFRLHEHVIFPSIIIGSILFVLVSVSLLIIFNRFTIKVLLFLYCGVRPFTKPNQKYQTATYDAFILYSYSDRAFLQHNLIERLKSKGFRVVDFYKDFIVGFSFLQNVETFIKRSKRVIFCWTGDMVKHDLIMSAWNMAYERAVKHDIDFLILVVDNDLDTSSCTDDNLASFLKRGKYIKKLSRYMFASVDYLMARTGSNVKIKAKTDEHESAIPMLSTVSSTITYNVNDLIYISYPEELDHEIRFDLIPYLADDKRNIKVLEHDFTPGADIRDEIHTKLDCSKHFIFIVSNSILNDDVKMFILTTVMLQSKLRTTNYLLMFKFGPLHEADCPTELFYYLNNFVTGSIRDENFRHRLLQAIKQN